MKNVASYTVEDSIKNNVVVSRESLKDYILSTIEREDLSHLCSEVKYEGSNLSCMVYDYNSKSVTIDFKQAASYIKENIFSNRDDISRLQQSKRRLNYIFKKYRVNMTNLFYLYLINHEIMHMEQCNMIKRNPDDSFSELLKISFDLIKLNQELYISIHNNYLPEYHANVSAGYKILSEIEANYKDVIGSRELEFFNMYLADIIANSYVQNSYNETVTPINFVRVISKYLCLNQDCYIRLLENTIKSENNVNDLLMGKGLSNDILNQISDISKGKVKSKNLFESIYQK